jgi:NNP family nitrate/nitrite transporter-like MFS transporter
MSSTINKPLDTFNLRNVKGIQMRTFHITWFTFFVCFFGWFGLAPLMPTIRQDLGLTKGQVGNLVIASVSATIIARLIVGRLCDLWGPRRTYTLLLLIGAVPVFLVGLSHSYQTFLLFRLFIGIIGASFVITQYHTSVMFAPNVKGTANAVAGGWGNLGGGVTNMIMPVIFAGLVGAGYTKGEAWRMAIMVPGIFMVIMAFVYYRFTKDTPAGNFSEIRKQSAAKSKISWDILKDWRIWSLALAYGVCFGMEITFDNVASLHFVDTFKLSQSSAGFWAGIFGFMNLFARALGGILADKTGRKWGLKGKGWLLAFFLLLEGIGLILFAQAGTLMVAIVSMLGFALFLKMANGATYSMAPFINEKNVGLVSGVIGAGGNLGGMMFGFLFKSEAITYAQAFTYIGFIILMVAVLVFSTRFITVKAADEVVLESEAAVA